MVGLGVSWRRLANFGRRRWYVWLPVAVLVLAFVVGQGIELRTGREFRAGLRAYQEDRLKDAQVHLQRYLEIRPGSVQAHLLAARIDRILGFHSNAEKHLNECKRLGGMTGDLQVEWLLWRAVNGEFPSVEKDLHQLVADGDPRSCLILETITQCCIGLLRYNSAMASLDSWLKKEPDNIRALGLRAYVWDRLQARDKAFDDYRRVVELSPKTWYARLALVDMLLAEKNTKEAGEHLQILRQNQGHEPGVLMALARQEILQGNLEEARRSLDDVLAQKPDHADALLERGKLELTSDPAGAEKYFRKALAHNENNFQARFQLFNALSRQGKKEAEAEKQKYLALKKDLDELPKILVEVDRAATPDLLAQAAAILIRGGDKQGTQLLFRALHLDPGHKRSHALLADYYEKTKQPGKAAQERQLAGLPPP